MTRGNNGPLARNLPTLRQVTTAKARNYHFYFYNPSLTPGGKLVYFSNRTGSEQLYAVDLATGADRQLTFAAGEEQHWFPFIDELTRGVRPQFACLDPGGNEAFYFEGNALKAVRVDSGESRTVHTLAEDRVPMMPQCSKAGLITFGYVAKELHEKARMANRREILWETSAHFGLVVLECASGRTVLDLSVPFWVNHSLVSPDGSRILFSQEGPWERQRMFIGEIGTGAYRPLRKQDDGASIGHEFWLSDGRVAYHGQRNRTGFFGIISPETGYRTERPVPGNGHYSHFHISPDGRYTVTDGEMGLTELSAASLASDPLNFAPIAEHDWDRTRDQRYHPHPHWSDVDDQIVFTGCCQSEPGVSHVYVLSGADVRRFLDAAEKA